MKKLLFVVGTLLITSSFVFASEKTEGIIDNFWNKGQVVKIVENNKITYANKSSISTIKVNGDDVEITTNAYNAQAKATWTLKIYDAKNGIFLLTTMPTSY